MSIVTTFNKPTLERGGPPQGLQRIVAGIYALDESPIRRTGRMQLLTREKRRVDVFGAVCHLKGIGSCFYVE